MNLSFKKEKKLKSDFILNPKVFDLTYTPQKIYTRKETELIFNNIKNFLKYSTPENVILIGQSGSGKSVTINYYKKELAELNLNVGMLYVNCRIYNSSYKIFCKLSGNKKMGLPLNIVVEQFFKSLDKNYIIVLDEVDNLQDKEILYYLSRVKEYNSCKHVLSLFLISNNINFEKEIDIPTKSSLRLQKEVFSNYKANDVYNIIKQRAMIGLKQNIITDPTLEYIAGIVVKNNFGDTRIAIRILYLAAQYAEEHNLKQIDVKTINEVYDKAVKNIEKAAVTNLEDTPFILLCSVIKSSNNTFQKIYELYRNLSTKLKIEPVSNVTCHKVLNYLQIQGLISLYKIRSGKSFIKTVECTLTDKGIDEELTRRFGIIIK